ncbi:glycosyltransferase (plasmid) [Haloferacaceae archaeon DSL9]
MTIRALSLVTNDRSRFYRQQVAGLEEHDIEVDTLSVPTNPALTDEVAERRRLRDYARFFSTAIRRSFDDYDLVHANYGLTAPGALLQPNLPVVLSLWGSDLMGEFGPVSRLCARLSDAVVVMSPEMARELGQPCHIIPHGVDMDKFRPVPQAEARSELGWNPDSKHVLFPYPTQRSVKDYPRAERVVDAAAAQVSTPVELQTVNNEPHSRMPLYMSAADALLLTSKREGSPNATKEALACNLPIVATDVGDVNTQLAGVDPGFVCRTDDELIAGLVDALRRGERSNGREAAASVRHDNLTAELARVYEDVAARSRRRSADRRKRAIPSLRY